MTNYTMTSVPKGLNAFVGRTLKAYNTNGRNMLVAIFYSCVDQIGQHGNTTKAMDIVKAVVNRSEYSDVTALMRALVEGLSFDKDGKAKLAKEHSVNTGNALIVLKHMNNGAAFTNVKMMGELGIAVHKAVEFSLDNWADSALRRLTKEDVDIATAIKALKNAQSRAQAKDKSKPIMDKPNHGAHTQTAH